MLPSTDERPISVPKIQNHKPFLYPLFISYSKMMFHQKCISLLLVLMIQKAFLILLYRC